MSLKQVVLTRPLERAQPLAQRLIEAGFEVLMLPALSILPIDHGESMAKSITGPPSSAASDAAQHAATKNTAGIDSNPDSGSGPRTCSNKAVGAVADSQTIIPTAADAYDAVVFVSRAAWQYYNAQTRNAQTAVHDAGEPALGKHMLRAWPAETMVACVGQATAQCIAQDLGCSLSDIVFPDDQQNQDSEALLTLLAPRLSAASRVLLVRGQTGRDWLADQLRARGVSVTCLPVYRREPQPWRADQIDTLCQWAGLGDRAGQMQQEVRGDPGREGQNERQSDGQSESLANASADSTDQASLARSALKPSAGIWLVTSSEGLLAVQAQFEAHGWFAHMGMCPEAVVVIHPRLKPWVRRWLDRWVGEAERSVQSGSSTDTTSAGGCTVTHEAISTVPIIVAQPTDDAIFEALLALCAS